MRLIGKFKEAHGLKGEIYVLVFSGDVSWLPKLKTFGVGILPPRGEEPPENAVEATMTCARAKPFKQGLILKAQEIADRTAAEKWMGRGFYVPDELFVSEEGENIYLSEIDGFQVEDVGGKTLGRIVGFSSNGAQDLLVLELEGGGEAEVPLVEAFLRRIDSERGVLVMELPEGLLELSASGNGE